MQSNFWAGTKHFEPLKGQGISYSKRICGKKLINHKFKSYVRHLLSSCYTVAQSYDRWQSCTVIDTVIQFYDGATERNQMS